MNLNFSRRSDETEIMDDFSLEGPELEKTLRDLDRINLLLGGNKISLQGIEKIIRNQPPDKEIHIADVGCGNGEMLRKIAKWGRKNRFNFRLSGIDVNLYAIASGKSLSGNFPEISLEQLDVFSEEFKQKKVDIVLCTLTLHHFTNQEIRKLIRIFYDQARLGVVINDLHRSKLAYLLFKGFCAIFINNEIARKDGLTSIKRSFIKEELQRFSADFPSAKHEINWKWAFRYQWVIKK